MLIEFVAGLLALGPLQRLFDFGAPVSKPVLRRLLFGLTPFGLFARGAKIDDGAHRKLDGDEIAAEEHDDTSTIQKME